jgi:LemA protein
MDIIVIIALIVVAIIVIAIVSTYNVLVEKEKKIERNNSLVDVYLKKRFDLIPNLVEVCKGYAKHEKETLEKVTELRSSFNEKPTEKNREELNEIYKQFIALAESYPEIKAGEHYLKLQKELANVEGEIQASRRIYINSITDYNNLVMRFPSSFIAKLFGYKQIELPKFEYDDVKVDFK